jgi:hypothetical protein
MVCVSYGLTRDLGPVDLSEVGLRIEMRSDTTDQTLKYLVYQENVTTHHDGVEIVGEFNHLRYYLGKHLSVGAHELPVVVT